MQRARFSFLVVVGLALACPPSRADRPKPIHPQTDRLPSVIAPPAPDALPGAVAAPNAFPSPIANPFSNSAVPTLTATRRLALPGLIEKLNSGQLAPQKAWDDKLIDADDLLWVFTALIEPWGGFGGKKNVEVRRALAGLLAKNGGEKLQDTAKLPPTVRLWLADYYEGIGDEKCLALCESILDEIKTPVQGENALAFQTVERIAWFHRDKKAFEKCAAAWLRVLDYHADAGWWKPDALLEAARADEAAGQPEKAEALYQKIPAYGNEYCSGLALYGRADLALAHGEKESARQLLLPLLAGDDSAPRAKEAAQSRMVLCSLLAWSHYREQEWQQAANEARRAVRLQQALPPDAAGGLDGQARWAQALADWSARWQQSPLWCLPESITERVVGTPALNLRFAVATAAPANIVVVSDNPLLTVTPLPPTPPPGKAACVRQEFALKIGANNIAQPLRANLTVTCPNWPDAKRIVPVVIESEP